MMIKTLFIHAGGPKTGSSALQNVLERNSVQLKTLGFEYNHKVGIESEYDITSGNGLPLFEMLNGSKISNPWDCGNSDKIKINSSVSNVSENELDSLVLSYFGELNNAICSSEFFSELQVDAWILLVKAAERHKITINVIYYIRDALSFYVSAYDQTIKRHGQYHSLEEFSEQQCWKHFKALQILQAVIPQSCLYVLSYENEKDRLVDSFLDLLGIRESLKVDNLSKQAIVNRSLSEVEREILIMFNKELGQRYSTEMSDLLLHANPNASPIHNYSEEFINVVSVKDGSNAKWINETFFKGKNVVSAVPSYIFKPDLRKKLKVEPNALNTYRDTINWAIEKLKTNINSDVLLDRLVKAVSTPVINHEKLPTDFDPLSYLLLNHDVLLTDTDPIDHYLNYGIEEGRQYNLSFRRIFPEQYERLLLVQKNKEEELLKIEQSWVIKTTTQNQEKQVLESQINALKDSLVFEYDKMQQLLIATNQAHADRERELQEKLITTHKELIKLEQSWVIKASAQTELSHQEKQVLESQINALKDSLLKVEQDKLQEMLEATNLEHETNIAHVEREQELQENLLKAKLDLHNLEHNLNAKLLRQQEELSSLQMDSNMIQNRLQNQLSEVQRTAELSKLTTNELSAELDAIKTTLIWRITDSVHKLKKSIQRRKK
jgi:hypothetical protein